MAYYSRPSLNYKQFDQYSTDCLYLGGTNCICNEGTISSDNGYKVSGITIFDTGIASSSIQIGCNSIASGIASTAVGAAAIANGTTSIAIGCNARACGEASISLGLSLSAGKCSIAIGHSMAVCNFAIAIGNSFSYGINALAIGNNVLANAESSSVIGSNVINTCGCSFGLGWYNGEIGCEMPSILFSNTKSYIYGCGDPRTGFGTCNPQATVHIRSTSRNGFILDDGNQGDGKVLMSDANGYATWTSFGNVSGTENYFSIFVNGGCGITDSILKFNSPNIIESQYNGRTIIRPYALPSGASTINSIEIHGGCKIGSNVFGDITLKTSNLNIVQPDSNSPTIIRGIGLKGTLLSSQCGSLTLSGSEGIHMNLSSGRNCNDISFISECNDITMKLQRIGNFNVCGYNSCDIDGGSILIKAGNTSSGNGGNLILQAGCGDGNIGCNGNIFILNNACSGNIYTCNLPNKTTETCAIYINSEGKISIGCISDNNIIGTKDYITKFNANGDNVINSSIWNSEKTICLGSQNIILGCSNDSSSIVMKPYDGTTTAVNLIIKAGCNSTNDKSDGCLFLDPGRGTTPHNLIIGSDTYNKCSVGIIPEGMLDDIKMFVCGKGLGAVGLSSNGGVLLGKPTNYFCIYDNNIGKLTKSDLCINGYDTIRNCDSAGNVYIRAGFARGRDARGGDLILHAGIEDGMKPEMCSSYQGRIYMRCLLPKSTETNVLYIDANGAISSGSIDVMLASDERYKTNIQPISIHPVNVEYKQFELKCEPNQLRYGVIAQDLQKENPELVRSNSKGMLSVAYIDLLIKEIAYLKYKVCELEKKVAVGDL